MTVLILILFVTVLATALVVFILVMARDLKSADARSREATDALNAVTDQLRRRDDAMREELEAIRIGRRW